MIIKPSSPLLDDTDAVVTPPATTSTPASKVATPREPTKAEVEVEFSDDLGITEPIEKSKEEKVEKKEEKVKVEPTKEVKQIVPPEKKVVAADKTVEKTTPKEITPIVPPSGVAKSRDYSGFSDEEVKVLKGMSNEAFSYSSKLFKEAKDLSKLKDAQFMQHPSAYTLDPNYQKLQEDASYFQQESDYWQSQLLAIAEGKEWAPITGWNKDGSPVMGPAQKPDKLSEERVRMAMNQCSQGAQTARQSLQQFSTDYQQRIAVDTQQIQQECSKYFGWISDPKLLDSNIMIPEVGEKSVRQVKDDFTSLFPAYHRNTVGVDIAGHMWVALQIYAQQIRELQEQKDVAEVRTEEVRRAEPTSKVTPGIPGKAINGVSEFSLEGMPT